MKTLHLLFSHRITELQRNDAYKTLGISEIEYPPDSVLRIWRNIPSGIETIKNHLTPVTDYIKSYGKEGDYILIQGDFGAVYLAVNWAFDSGLVPVYSTTERIHSESYNSGSVEMKKVFRHKIFRFYER